jgi:hypothetical protein
VAAAQAAAGLTGSLLFDPSRATRLVEQHARNGANPGLAEMVRQIAAATWLAPSHLGLAGEVKASVDLLLFQQVLALASNEHASPLVRARLLAAIASLSRLFPEPLARVWRNFEQDPGKFKPAPVAEAPPGQPIGEEECARPLLPSLP